MDLDLALHLDLHLDLDLDLNLGQWLSRPVWCKCQRGKDDILVMNFRGIILREIWSWIWICSWIWIWSWILIWTLKFTYDYSWEGLKFMKFSYDSRWEGLEFMKFTYDYSWEGWQSREKTYQKCSVYDTWSRDVMVFKGVNFWNWGPSPLECTDLIFTDTINSLWDQVLWQERLMICIYTKIFGPPFGRPRFYIH